MSVEVAAILDHRLDVSDTRALPGLLHPQVAPNLATAITAQFKLLKPSHPLLSEDEGWQVGWTIADPQWTQGDVREIIGPAGVSIVVGSRLCEVSFFWRWSSFLVDAPIRASVQHVCCELAHLVGANGIVYVPDSAYPVSGVTDLVFNGASLTEARVWLRERCGPPASTPEQIIIEVVDKSYQYEVDPNGYLVDVFPKARHDETVETVM